MSDEVLSKVAAWALFGVLASVVPVGVDMIRLYGAEAGNPFTEATCRGELLLITAALCAAGLGELSIADGGASVWRTLAAGTTVLTLFTAAMCYSEAAKAYRARRGSRQFYSLLAVCVFLLGAVCSGACVILAAIKPHGG